MSRIGNKNIPLSAAVTVTVNGQEVTAKGPKGELSYTCPALITPSISEDAKELIVARANDSRQAKAFHGLSRSLINNMVVGVEKGWEKQLEIRGTGYKAAVQGKVLNLALGYSHPINFEIPEGLTITIPENNKISISGADKQLVGQAAANIRFYRKPESYKGKGVRYVGEHIALKEGKSAGK